LLTGNMLKIIALITMTIDHIGMILFPTNMILRIIGRMAFPIYGYMIAEGCRYTKNRPKYLFSILSVGIICQIAYLVAMGSVYQCIMITFSMSLAVIYTFDLAAQKRVPWPLAVGVVILSFVICEIVPSFVPESCDFAVDYGFCGVIYPFLIYIAQSKRTKLFMALVGLILVSMSRPVIQIFSLLALIPLALYSGERGKLKLKYLFYVYYPVHLAIIYLISAFV